MVAVARLDQVLVDRGMAETVDRARGLIAAGLVEVDGARPTSSAQTVADDAAIRLLGQRGPWASRAGEKLVAALDAWSVGCTHRVALDSGASTGGFSSVLLARGIARIYAVDVGYGQLDTAVAADPRVVVMDRTNLRTLEAVDGPTPDLVTLDLSFISLRSVIPSVVRLAPGAEMVALFKPQFEVPKEMIGKGGVVRDTQFVDQAIGDFERWCSDELGATSLSPRVASPLRGAKGNQEWFVHMRLSENVF